MKGLIPMSCGKSCGKYVHFKTYVTCLFRFIVRWYVICNNGFLIPMLSHNHRCKLHHWRTFNAYKMLIDLKIFDDTSLKMS